MEEKSLLQLIREEPDEKKALRLIKEFLENQDEQFKKKYKPLSDYRWSLEREKQYIEEVQRRKSMNMPIESGRKMFYIADESFDQDDSEKLFALIDVCCWYGQTHCFTRLFDRLILDDSPILQLTILEEQGEPGSCIFRERQFDLIKMAMQFRDSHTLRLLYPFVRSNDEKEKILEWIAEIPE